MCKFITVSDLRNAFRELQLQNQPLEEKSFANVWKLWPVETSLRQCPKFVQKNSVCIIFKKIDFLVALKNGGPYICDLCGKVYKCRETIAAHFSYIHGPRKIFSCDQCPKTYTAYSALSSHKKFSHKEYEPFVCDICGRKTKTKAEARSHVFTHQSKSKCRICHKFVANLMGHMWTHKKKKISCTICGEMIVKKCMEQHIKARHVEKPKPFKCEQCDEAFLRKRDLVKHKKEKHGFKLFRCHCSYRIDCPKRFREHKKLHKKGTSTYVCSVSQKISSRYFLKTSLHLPGLWFGAESYQRNQETLEESSFEIARTENFLYQRIKI